MRKINRFVLSILFSSLTLIANEATANQKSQLGLDELIKKMNRADASERYKYMNKVKDYLKQMNAQQRIQEISKLQQKIDASKEAIIANVETNREVNEVKKEPKEINIMPSGIEFNQQVNTPSIPNMPGY